MHVGDLVLLKIMVFKGKCKLKDYLEKTIYWVEGQPYAGSPVFRIAWEGKVNIVHQNLLLPFGGNVQGSENDESQQDVDGLSDCIQSVSDDGEAETEEVSTDPECENEDDAIMYSVHNLLLLIKNLIADGICNGNRTNCY